MLILRYPPSNLLCCEDVRDPVYLGLVHHIYQLDIILSHLTPVPRVPAVQQIGTVCRDGHLLTGEVLITEQVLCEESYAELPLSAAGESAEGDCSPLSIFFIASAMAS